MRASLAKTCLHSKEEKSSQFTCTKAYGSSRTNGIDCCSTTTSQSWILSIAVIFRLLNLELAFELKVLG